MAAAALGLPTELPGPTPVFDPSGGPLVLKAPASRNSPGQAEAYVLRKATVEADQDGGCRRSQEGPATHAGCMHSPQMQGGTSGNL